MYMENNQLPPQQDGEFIISKIAYAGRIESSEGKIWYKYYLIHNHEYKNGDEVLIDLDKRFVFETKLFKDDKIGFIHEILVNGDNIKYNKSKTRLFFSISYHYLAEWKATDVAVDVTRRLKADTTVRNGMEQALSPIKKAYRQADTQGRAQILAEIIRIVTG